MIQANELRIGNWVQSDGKTYLINDISPDDKWEPIPLTTEIFKSMGWIPIEPKGWWSKRPAPESQEMVFFKPHDEPFHYVDGAFSPEVKYVHQLQNLYFALMGVDLVISI